MASAQPGIFALGTTSHTYLELDLIAGADPAAAVALVADLREPRTTIRGVNLVAGFRPELWAQVAPDAAPSGVADFNAPVVGPSGYTLPATQHDVVIWLTGATYDVVFDLARGTTPRRGNALPVAAQEDVIGRRKADSVELDPRPPASHVARTDQDAFGKIFRRNIGYGSIGRHGTIFVGPCADQRILAAMLTSMVGSGDGPADHLTASPGR